MMPSQDEKTAQYGRIEIDLMFTAGASGAVPSALTVSTGITSVVKSTNDYIVTFDQSYLQFLGGGGNIIQATPSAAAAFEVKHTAFNLSSSGFATVTVSPMTAAGAATALAVGDILQYQFYFTTVPQPNS